MWCLLLSSHVISIYPQDYKGSTCIIVQKKKKRIDNNSHASTAKLTVNVNLRNYLNTPMMAVHWWEQQMIIFVPKVNLGFQRLHRSQIPFATSNINQDSSVNSLISSDSFTASAAANDLLSASATLWEAMLLAPSNVLGSNRPGFLEVPAFASPLCLGVGILEPVFFILKRCSTCSQKNTNWTIKRQALGRWRYKQCETTIAGEWVHTSL